MEPIFSISSDTSAVSNMTQSRKLLTNHSSEKSSGIIEILRYLKSAFDDEAVLDGLPSDAVGNPGAWNAWQAYRKDALSRTKASLRAPTESGSADCKPMSKEKSSTHFETQEEWSWEGVWQERVQKTITASTSDAVLYGYVGGGDDLVCPRISD